MSANETRPTSALDNAADPEPGLLDTLFPVDNSYDPKRVATPSPARLLLLSLQAALLVGLFVFFEIESDAFGELMMLAAGGFVVHALLPFRYRLAFFTLLSIAGLVLVLGWFNAAWIVGVGGVFIALCHLPIALRWRVLAVVLAAGVALVARLHPSTGSSAVWPVLTAMFMFRLIMYLYDLRHDRAPKPPWGTLAYFFLLPNICFPLFPLVDAKTFRRTYYDVPAAAVYQSGLTWMFRGFFHLMGYRILYYHFTLSADQVQGFGDFAQFIFINFPLYLRISGQFHIIIGILMLFGFHLPRTHYNYFLSSSYSDIWRRVNIYWKDFMTKLFFYPISFRLKKKLGSTPRLLVTMLIVLFISWLLHSYQWLWLGGEFPITVQDAVFWSALAVLAGSNLAWDNRKNKKKPKGGFATYLFQGCTVMLTFLSFSILWSFWTSEDLEIWLGLWGIAAESLRSSQGQGELLTFVAICAGLLVLAAFGRKWEEGQQRRERELAKTRKTRLPGFVRPAVQVGLMALVLVLGVDAVRNQFPAETANVMQDLQRARLSHADERRLEHGYYENLQRLDRINSELWSLYLRRPQNPEDEWGPFQHTGGLIKVKTFEYTRLKPNFKIYFKGADLQINSAAFRDKEYSVKKEPGTFRIAVVGPSHSFGSGVENHLTFEALLEQMFAEKPLSDAYTRIEILNFSMPGSSPPQYMYLLENKIQPYEPDALLYTAFSGEGGRTVQYLKNVMHHDMPYPDLAKALKRSGVNSKTSVRDFRRLMERHGVEPLDWVYERIRVHCKKHNIIPIWAYFTRLNERPQISPAMIKILEEKDFYLIDFAALYSEYNAKELQIAEFDHHVNAFAHRLTAEAFYEEFKRRPELLGLGPDFQPKREP